MTLEETFELQLREANIAARSILQEMEEKESEEESEPEEAQETEEPREYLIVQRRYFEATRQTAISLLPHISTFGNHRDHETYVQIWIAQRAGIAYCNTKDVFGGQLADTVEDLAIRCVNAEAGSKKQSKLIDDLKEENSDLREQLAHTKGSRK